MPRLIPFTNDGSRRITVSLEDKQYIFETYYLPNIRRWLMDIYDIDETPLSLGICLNVGVGNLVRGHPMFENKEIRCVSPSGTENNTPSSLGTTCFVYFYETDETAPVLYEDKMIG